MQRLIVLFVDDLAVLGEGEVMWLTGSVWSMIPRHTTPAAAMDPDAIGRPFQPDTAGSVDLKYLNWGLEA